MRRGQGQISALSVVLGLLFFIAAFLTLITLKTSIMTSNNVTLSGEYDSAEAETRQVLSDLGIDVEQTYDVTFDQEENVTGGAITPEQGMFESARKFIFSVSIGAPLMVYNLVQAFLSPLGVPAWLINIVIFAFVSVVLYAGAVFLRRGF